MMTLEARRQGVHPSCLAHWIHRKFGDFIITKVRKDEGGVGTSLPCVICRKSLDRKFIQWRAHIESKWVRSTDEFIPKSKPTNKQKQKLGFK
jgi:hypothetical protein